jgi:hypothetical protein
MVGESLAHQRPVSDHLPITGNRPEWWRCRKRRRAIRHGRLRLIRMSPTRHAARGVLAIGP